MTKSFCPNLDGWADGPGSVRFGSVRFGSANKKSRFGSVRVWQKFPVRSFPNVSAMSANKMWEKIDFEIQKLRF